MDLYSSKYDNFFLLGDLNSQPSEPTIKDFCQLYSCKNIIKDNTCFKNVQNPSCIDLIITNRPKSFQNSVVIETGLSDFHKMSLTVMKVFYKKQKPNIIEYRDYRNFDNDFFMADLRDQISKIGYQNVVLNFDLFKKTADRMLHKHIPLKKRYVRANEAPFMNKKIKKEIMKRSRLKSKFLNSKNDKDRNIYNKQRNLCVSLIRQGKKQFFNAIKSRDINDNKTFWKTVKPFFTEKVKTKSKITLIENRIVSQDDGNEVISEEVVSDDKAVAEIFNEFFINIVPNLKISAQDDFNINFIKSADPILNSVNKFQNHPSIIMIKENKETFQHFSFSPVCLDSIIEKTNNLNTAKTSQKTDIPTRILKQNSGFFSEYFYENINCCIKNSAFPLDLKIADVTPIHKKKSKSSKDNYRPVSILPNISKIYERCLFDQMETFFENILSKYQCGFRKRHNAQHCLILLIEKWKKSVDNGGAFGVLLTDLSKAFDCLSHELLIAKLEAYGFDKKSLALIYDYLLNRKQKVKINNSFSSWGNLAFGVPQGSILGPLLFNIFICDMFYFLKKFDLVNYADDTSPFCVGNNHESVIKVLEQSSAILFKWLKENYMKVNTDKSHLLLSGNTKHESNIDNNIIKSEPQQELLGITIDSNLSFEDHVNKVCQKTSQKLNALARISPFMDENKRKIIMKSFITSQFGYCPLIWMFHSRNLNNKINSLHERALRITYNDRFLTFQELLEKDNSVSIHQRNLQVLAVVMFKIYRNISTKILNDIFLPKINSYDLRNKSTFESRKVNSVYHGTESLSFLGPKIWDLVPPEMKEIECLEVFKNKIKSFTFSNCPCRLCRTYIAQIGFI